MNSLPTTNRRSPPNPGQPFQFDLATMLWAMGAVAVFCFLWRWQHYFPFWLIVPSASFLVTWFAAKRKVPPDLIWGLFAISWCLANRIIAKGLLSILMVTSGPVPLSDMQDSILKAAFGSAVLLPVYLSCPIITLAWKASGGNHSFARKWLILCPIIGLLDVTTLTVTILMLIRHTWPWWQH